ncbi:hypothetical protein KEM52_000238 [Ascosphaera acerosa]|nr:hypothetical protein KEM52_000238 [Ascosphaera acerosa]
MVARRGLSPLRLSPLKEALHEANQAFKHNVIRKVRAAQRLDSRGQPTVQVTVTTGKGKTVTVGTAALIHADWRRKFTDIVPSGASKGDYEAVELRDGDSEQYDGRGVLKAVANVNRVLGPALVEKGLDVVKDREAIDKLMVELDGTPDKSKYGANAILGISMAVLRAAAGARDLPLYEVIRQEASIATYWVIPTPFFNVLNGGKHSGSPMAFQEFMIAPVGAPSFTEAVRYGCETYQALKRIIAKKYGQAATNVGDEGGFSPPISSVEEALDLLVEAVKDAGHTNDIAFGIDSASSEFYDKQKDTYNLGFKSETPSLHTPGQLANLYLQLLQKYPIILLEDPFAQDDWASWKAFNKQVGSRIELVGDDLLATNISRMKVAKKHEAVNSLLLKINQIGTISESMRAAQMALTSHWRVFLSHRSGETTDDFIADLAVGLGIGHMKCGAPCRGERVAKYNRVMDIEDECKRAGRHVVYAGRQFGQAIPIEVKGPGYFS